MWNLLSLLVLGILLQSCIELSDCDCLLEFPQDWRNAPRYTKTVGSQTIDVPLTRKSIQLRENEYITGYCDTKFRDLELRSSGWRDYDNVKITSELTIYCKNDALQYKNQALLRNYVLECETMEWSLYESLTPFAWCEASATSYSLISPTKYPSETLADVCFDLKKSLIRSLHYWTGIGDTHFKGYVLRGPPFRHFDLENKSYTYISNFDTIFNYKNISDLQGILNEHSRSNYWLKFANYEYSSLVQDHVDQDYFDKFPLLLSVIWWRNLLHGNWRKFTDALAVSTKNDTYPRKLYTGVSGELHLPTPKRGIMGEIAEFGDYNQHIPSYMWQYVTGSSGDKAEEFVFVGYNSPFFDFFHESEVVFCKDICDQISWLNETRSTFRHSVLGIVFCCSVEEVRSSNLLDGFPIAPKEPNAVTTTTLEPFDETTEVQSYDLYQNEESEENYVE